MAAKERSLKYVKRDQLVESIQQFDPKYTVTKGEFSIDVPCLLKDMEWNHMDQAHRPFIHNTYQTGLRIALGRDFALSLTRWGRWPFLITVTDVRADEGLFYQDMVLAGVIFIHNIISMKEENQIVHLKLEWIIQSHRFLKFAHGILGRMFTKLNVRLQEEDAQVRAQRFHLRRLGYSFRSDPPDYYTSNQMTNNTVYPPLRENASLALADMPFDSLALRSVGDVEFAVKRTEEEVLIWPGACPHEGGELVKGTLKDCRLECPWHGLKFTAARLSPAQPSAQAYGFEYTLQDGKVHIRQKA